MKLINILIVGLSVVFMTATQTAAAAPPVTDTFTTIARLHLKQVPLDITHTLFREVHVLDNRYDISHSDVLTDERTEPCYTFGEPLANAIATQLSATIDSLQKGDKSLLLNIREFRISRINLNSNPGFLLCADAYCKTGTNAYRKIAVIHYAYSSSQNINEGISWVLQRILAISGGSTSDSLPRIHDKKNRYLKGLEKDYITYTKNPDELPLEQIDLPLQKKWADMSIFTGPQVADGIYSNFMCFSNNEICPDTLQPHFDPKDSVFHILPLKRPRARQGFPFALAYQGDLYLKLLPYSPHDNRYLKVDRSNGAFYFNIPLSLPDYPALQKLNSIYNRDLNAGGGGSNPLGDLIVMGIEAVVMGPINAVDAKKVLRKGMPGKYRTCYLDMEVGEILCRR